MGEGWGCPDTGSGCEVRLSLPHRPLLEGRWPPSPHLECAATEALGTRVWGGQVPGLGPGARPSCSCAVSSFSTLSSWGLPCLWAARAGVGLPGRLAAESVAPVVRSGCGVPEPMPGTRVSVPCVVGPHDHGHVFTPFCSVHRGDPGRGVGLTVVMGWRCLCSEAKCLHILRNYNLHKDLYFTFFFV